MKARFALAALALMLTACDRDGAQQAGSADAPQLDAPAPESEPSRAFTASNDGARSVTGDLNVTMSTRLPDSSQAGAAPQDVLSLRGANGLVVDAEITGATSPATLVDGQTLRALLSLPVEEPQVLVYRVAAETKPESGRGLCGTDAAAFVVVWEPTTPGDSALKVLGVTGGAPGAANARACPALEYGRN